MTTQELYKWQQELRSQPKVWWVGQWFEGTLESTGNLYATKEGAEAEAEYLRAKKRRVQICSENIHTDDLARRRWGVGGNAQNESS